MCSSPRTSFHPRTALGDRGVWDGVSDCSVGVVDAKIIDVGLTVRTYICAYTYSTAFLPCAHVYVYTYTCA